MGMIFRFEKRFLGDGERLGWMELGLLEEAILDGESFLALEFLVSRSARES